jgi:hypothetical protein
MTHSYRFRVLAVLAGLGLAMGCSSNSPTSPTAVSPLSQSGPTSQVSAGAAAPGGPAATMAGRAPQVQAGAATGERVVGKAAIEPAYDADSGELMYLLTPEKAPLPSKANGHAVSPLYLVEYPVGSSAAGAGHFNCEGVPGNCPDHDGLVADVAANAVPAVYGAGVLGHDHVADPPGKPDFNVAWQVIEVVFTAQGVSDGAVNTRLTTDAAIDAAFAAHDAMTVDLGFAFNCSVVSASAYWHGTPVG